MQARSSQFDVLAKGYVRPITASVKASFDKTFNDDTTFFTLDTSVLDGTDILAPIDDNPVQEWDRYEYADLYSRIISVEATRQETEPYSVAQSFADVTLNNYDKYFTPNSGSPIDQFIIPRRPFRVGFGFGSEPLQQIVGLTAGMPEIDKISRTASFHVVDFMSYLYDKDIGESIILQNVKTHEVLDYLFQYLGLLDTQYSLDESLNTIKFFFVEKGTKFGDIVSDLLEAEIGRLFLDELGVIRFRNRYNYDTIPVYTFDHSNTINYEVSDEDLIINSVKITSNVREVQDLQSVWRSTQKYIIPAGESIDVFVEFTDPITTLNDPIYSAIELNDSYFISTSDQAGTTPYTNIDLTSSDLFSKAAKLTFENTGGTTAYIYQMDLFGTPAKVVNTIKVEEQDEDSVMQFEEQKYEISNDFIQDRDGAASRALILINDYKEYGSVLDIEVKGNPALQLGDPVTIDLDGYQGLYFITKEVNIISEGKFTQRLRVRNKFIPSFFILDQSLLDNGDLLSP